ncbi:MAG TPA: tocopherol cyclase family protein [Actinomycetota bacterium]|nr:tocopherol cyclase family protein [Actinomycetota bacterium]
MAERDNLPRWNPRAGGHESWSLTATDTASGEGLWIRMGIAGRRGVEPAGEVVAARFHPTDPDRTFGVRSTHPSPDFTLGGPDRYLRTGASELGPGFARGGAAGAGHRLEWDLAFETGEPTYTLLPGTAGRGLLGELAAVVPNVDTAVSGTVTADGEALQVTAARGQQGHVSGRYHAERWVWAHCSGFDDGDTIVEAVTGQIRRGPFVTPFVTSIGVRREGRWIRLVRPAGLRDFSMGRWRIDLTDRRFRITGRIEAPSHALVQARLEGPDGVPRYCHHSDIGSCRLALFERRSGGFDQIAMLEAKGTVQAEWVGRTPSSAVERLAAGA